MPDVRRSAATAVPLAPPVSLPAPAIGDAKIEFYLLVCAFFLQRFVLTFGHSYAAIMNLPILFVIGQQYISGRLVIQYDRLLWFFAVGICIGYSLFLNFNSRMLPSFALFMVLYSLFTLVKPTTGAQYRSVLRAYQSVVAAISVVAILQFAAQFVVNGKQLVQFFGVIPKTFFDYTNNNTIIPIIPGSGLIKSNGLFLGEPSTLSQVAALAILIEVLEFRRAKHLLLFTAALALSYSGTGLMIILAFVLPAALRYNGARLPVLLMTVLAVLLVVTGVIDLTAFTERAGELNNVQASGFQRFISPFWLAQRFFETASPAQLLFGNGPGTSKFFTASQWYSGFVGTWIKLIYEYGLIGSFVFVCFLISCLRKSKCPRLVLVALIFWYIFLGGDLLSPFAVTVIAVLCTLSGPSAWSNAGDLQPAGRFTRRRSDHALIGQSAEPAR